MWCISWLAHWLPIRQRIVYRQCLMTYKAVHNGQPNYLNELIQPYQPVRTLRSSTSALLVIPFVRSDFASDTFSVSSPTLWNNVLQDVQSCANQVTFKSRLNVNINVNLYSASSQKAPLMRSTKITPLFSRLYRLVTPCVCAPILIKIPGAI